MRQGLAVLAFLFAASAAQAQTAFDRPGPYTVRSSTQGPGCVIFRPAELGDTPRPLILWGNGTQTPVTAYAPTLQLWASHGFIVAASLSGMAGSGHEMLACLDYLAAENARSGSTLKGRIDLSHVGASGHSQGAAGAIMAGRDPRVVATAPIQPSVRGQRYVQGAEGQQHGPMLLLSGGIDTIAPPDSQQAPVFAGANVQVDWLTLKSGSHLLPANGDNGAFKGAAAAWFAWRLMGDAEAAALFQGPNCHYCSDPDWTLQRHEAP